MSIASLQRRGIKLATLIAATLAVGALAPMTGSSADVGAATIPVGIQPAAIAVNALTGRVYVANAGGNTVSIIDRTTESVIATLSTGSNTTYPDCVVVNPLSTPNRAYVGNFWNGTLSVIDESSGVVTATLPAATHGGGPRALALDPGAATPRLYSADYGNDMVSVFNAVTHVLITRIPVGDAPRALGIFASAPRRRIFVANRYSNTVSVIDGASDAVIATLTVGAAPKAIAVDDSTGFAYVTNESSNAVSVIDASDTVTATISVGQRPIGIAVDSANGRVFVANFNGNSVSVIRTSDFSVEATVAVGTNPWGVAVDPLTSKAYVTNYGSASVSVIKSDLSAQTATAGTNPYAIAVNPGVEAYCTNWTSRNVTVIRDNGIAMAVPFGGARPAYAALGAPASERSIAIDVQPLAYDRSHTGTFTVSGTARCLRAIPSAVVRVLVRVDGGAWAPVALQPTGGDATAVSWSFSATGLGLGKHTIEITAFDETGAAGATSEMGSGSKVSAAGGDATYDIEVVAPPRIASLSRTRGGPGTQVTVTGTGFGSVQGSGKVTFGGVSGTAVSWSDTQVVATVPEGAKTGYVGVTQYGRVSNGIYFVPFDPPQIHALSAASGAWGEYVTISGTGFGATQGTGRVTFGGLIATVSAWSANSIVAAVPTGAGNGYVGVTRNGMGSNGKYFLAAPARPKITALSRTSGTVGTLVTITGTGFGDSPTKVTLGGVTIPTLTWSSTQVTFAVPSGIAPGYLGVWNRSLGSNGMWFSPAPRLDSVAPYYGRVGTLVVLTGAGFGATQGDGSVTFAGVPAPIVSWSDTVIVASVPSGAVSGYAGVKRWGRISNGKVYYVRP